MKSLLVILLYLCFTSCSLNDKASTNALFNYPLLSLPINNVCDDGLEGQNLVFRTESEIRYRVIGRLPYNDNNNIYLLCCIDGGDISMPTICTYNSIGQLLQSFQLLLNGCVSDEESNMENRYVINTNMDILSTETISYGSWKSTFVVDSTSVRTRHAKINDRGIFEVDIESKSVVY